MRFQVAPILFFNAAVVALVGCRPAPGEILVPTRNAPTASTGYTTPLCPGKEADARDIKSRPQRIRADDRQADAVSAATIDVQRYSSSPASSPYFAIVKERIQSNWRPAIAFQRRDPRLDIDPKRAWLTMLKLTLTEAGDLVDVCVSESSGLPLLDGVAVTAAMRASPFEAPPESMLQTNRQLRVRFGFVFDARQVPKSVDGGTAPSSPDAEQPATP